MKMLKVIRTSLCLAGFEILLASYTAILLAQVDPTAVLIGTWDGRAERVRGLKERTLVVRSMKPNDEGGWVAQGNFGITGRRLPRETIDVTLENGETTLKFVNRAHNLVRLVLKADNQLQGTLSWARPNAAGVIEVPSPLKLEKKVERNTGD